VCLCAHASDLESSAVEPLSEDGSRTGNQHPVCTDFGLQFVSMRTKRRKISAIETRTRCGTRKLVRLRLSLIEMPVFSVRDL
jgi:hypothetical protein